MMRHGLSILIAWITLSGTGSAQIVQNFEDNAQRDPLLYQQCFVGESVRIDSQGTIQGNQQLSAGPLNTNRLATYRTPFLNVSSTATFTFRHMAEDAGNRGMPQILVDLIDAHDQVVATIYSLQYTAVRQVVTTTLPFGRDGIYRVQWRFTGVSGNDRVALDEVLLNAAPASSAFPDCGPLVASDVPPVARPDAASSPSGFEVIVNVLANDSDPDGSLDPATVDLHPDDPSVSHALEIRDAAGTLIGHAESDLAGNVTVTSVPGFVGSLVVPYSVRDNDGAHSNTSVLIVAVIAPRTDLALTLTGPATTAVGSEDFYLATVRNLGPDALQEGQLVFQVSGPIGSIEILCALRHTGCKPPIVAGGTISIEFDGLESDATIAIRLHGTTTGAGTIAVQANVAPAAPSVDSTASNNSGAVTTTVEAVVVGADLVLAVTGPAEVVPGTQAVYTVTITNNGPEPAAGVQVTSAGPLGFAFEGASGACTAFPCSLGTLPVGTVTFTARYRLSRPPGTILHISPANNFATVSSTTADPDPGSNTDSVTTIVLTNVDVVMGAGTTNVDMPLGQTARVIVTAGNHGPNPARNVRVRLTAPPQVSLASFSVTDGAFDPATGAWQIPEIGVDSQAELTLVVGATAQGSFTLRARTEPPPPTDSDSTNDETTVVVNVGPSADVGAALSVGTTAPVVGVPFTVQVLAGNLGPGPSAAASARVTLPSGLRLMSAAPPIGTFNPATGIWVLGPLAPGAILTLPLVVVAESAAPIVVRAAASSSTFDPNPSNNSHALALNASSSADLSLTMMAGSSYPVVGQTVTVRAVVANGGPSPAPATAVTFTGAGLTPINVSVSAGAITGPGQWTIGTLPPHTTATLDAVVRIDAPGALTAAGIAATSAIDPDSANNVATVPFNSVPDPGTVGIDFEDLTGTQSCWIWPGMAPGGLMANGMPFGRDMMNPPLQGLVHLVSSSLTQVGNQVVSPWIQLYGAGQIRFETKLTNRTSAPVIRVHLEDVATGAETLIFEKAYTSDGAAYDVVPIAVTGIYRLRWTFSGNAGTSRAAIDDITITGTQATAETGGPGQPIPPFDCRPFIPGDTPPLASPDFATTPIGTPVVMSILANDRDSDGTLNPARVNLDPVNSLHPVASRDVRRADGVVLGHAAVDSAGRLTFTPVAGLTGAGSIPYTVPDDRGGVSNITFAAIEVGATDVDLNVRITGSRELPPSTSTTYLVEVGNAGPGTSVPATLRIDFPGVTLVSVRCQLATGPAACGTATTSGTSATATMPGIGAGGVVSFAVSATMPPTVGIVMLSASVSAVMPATESNPADNSAVLDTMVGTQAPRIESDVRVTLTGALEVPLGGTGTYRALIDNHGPSAATGVELGVTVPTGFTFVSASGACTASPPCQLGTLAVGAQRVVVLRYRAEPAVTGLTAISDFAAAVMSSTPDPDLSNNRSVLATEVSPDYDLSATASATPTSASRGATIETVFVVENPGPALATAVAATMQVSPGLSVVSGTPTRGAFNPSDGTWTIGTLADNETVELSVQLRVDADGPLAAGIAISSGLTFDTDSSNNSATVELTGVASADVGVLQTVDNDAPGAGDVIMLTLTATNDGPSAAPAVVIQTGLPSALVLQGSSPSRGTFGAATGVWALGSLAAGETATLVQTVQVTRAGTFSTGAVVSQSGAADPNLANNSTGVMVNGGPVADLGVTIRVPATATVGGQVAIRVTVTNAGPSDATDVFVRGVIPPGLRIVARRPSVGMIDELGRWSVGALARGTAAILDLTANVVSGGVLTGSAIVTHAAPDPNAVNDQATATIHAAALTDVRVTVTAGTPQAVVSDDVTLFVAVTNEGPSVAASVEVDVALAAPPALTLVTGVTGAGSFNPVTGRWSVGPMLAGESKLLTLVARVGNPGSHLVIARRAPGTGGDANPANDQGLAYIEVADSARTVADLSLTLRAPGSIAPGGAVTLLASAFNAGSTYAVDLVIDLDVPAGLDVVSVTPSFRGSCPTVPPPGSAGAIRCVWPGQTVVGGGRPRSVQVVLHAAPGATPGTRTAVTGRASSLTPDRVPGNNAASAVIAIAGATLPDVALAKTIVPSGAAEISAAVGEQVRYRLSVQNLGVSTASDVRVTDELGLLQIVNATPSQGSFAADAWLVGMLDPGATATLDVTAVVAATGRDLLTATVTTGPPGDNNAANDHATITLDARGEGAGSRFVATGNVDAVGSQEIIAGTGVGEPGQVRVFDGQGRALARFYAYDPLFAGGVRVAACDIDGDGRDEIVTGAGPGGGPHVRVFQAVADRVVEVNSFYSDGVAYPGGIYVACADVTGDGRSEIITGTGTVGPATIRVWEVGLFTSAAIATWQAGEWPEARVAACDINDDGRAEVLVTTGPGTAATLRAYDGTGELIGGLGVLHGSIVGAFAACGDVLPERSGPEIVISSDAGGSPLVEVYTRTGSLAASFLADEASARGGVRVAIGDVDGSAPGSELVVGSGINRPPILRVGSAGLGPMAELRSIVVANLP